MPTRTTWLRRARVAAVSALLALAAVHGRLAAQEPPAAGGTVPVAELLTRVEIPGEDCRSASGPSFFPRVTPDGRMVVLESRAADLTPLDTDIISDVLLLDVANGRFFLVSADNPQLDGKRGDSFDASVSDEALRVVFTSVSERLGDDVPPAGAKPVSQVYLAELLDPTAPRVLLLSKLELQGKPSVPGNGPSREPEISADGTTVAFTSLAGNLGDPAFPEPLEFETIHVQRIGEPTRRLAQREPPDGHSSAPDVSGDGKVVVFMTEATNFPLANNARDGDRLHDILLAREGSPEFELVSVATTGTKLPGPSRFPRIDRSGTTVAFVSRAGNVDQIMVRDLANGVTEVVSRDAAGAPASADCMIGDISPDAAFVVFTTVARMTPDDSNDLPDTYLRDLRLGTTTLVSRSSRTLLAGGSASQTLPFNGSITGPLGRTTEGRAVVFFSPSNVIGSPGCLDGPRIDGSGDEDVFVLGLPETDTVALALPPSNNLHLPLDGQPGIVQQVSLDGELGRRAQRAGLFGGIAVDEANVLWLLEGTTLRQLEAATLRDIAFFELPLDPAARRHGMIAFGGDAYVAVGQEVVKITPITNRAVPLAPGDGGGQGGDGIYLATRFDLGQAPRPFAQANLAADPEGNVWLGLAFPLSYELLKFGKPRVDANGDPLPFTPVRRIPFEFTDPGRVYHMLAIDAAGDLLLRSRRELAKVAQNGNVVWRRSFPKAIGDGLAIDGAGNAYTVVDGELGGLRPDGTPFFRLDLAPFGLVVPDPGPGGTRTQLVLDGASDLWLLVEGQRLALKVEGPASAKPIIPKPIVVGDGIAAFLDGDITGYIDANVPSQLADSDRDTFGNRREIERLDNPFDPSPPLLRFPGLRELTATVIDGGARVQLDWLSPAPFCEYVVIRNGQMLPGAAERTAVDRFRFFDDAPPGGLSRYVVFGRGICEDQRLPILPGDGGGAGLPPVEESDPVEASVVVGQGAIVDTASSISATYGDPTAAAISSPENEATFAVPGALVLVSIDATEFKTDDIDFVLPGPLATAVITGLEYDPNDADFYWILTEEGEVYHYELGGAATLEFDLETIPGNVTPEGDTRKYFGLALRGEIAIAMQNSFRFLASEPTIECLIGFRLGDPNKGRIIARQRIAGSTGLLPCRDLKWAAGIAALDPGTADSIVVGLGSSSSTVDELVRLGVTGTPLPSFSDGGAGLSLDTATLGTVFDIKYAPGLERLVVACTNGPALISATFPPAPQVALTPERAKWDTTVPLEIDVDYAATGKAFADLGLAIFVDGVETPPTTTTVNGADTAVTFELTVNGSAPRTTRNLSISVHSTEGSSTCELALGFIRGDANNDGELDISDCVFLLLHLFTGAGVTPECLDAANVNDDLDEFDGNNLDINDPVVILEYLYRAGPPPASPFADFGIDKTIDDTTECSE